MEGLIRIESAHQGVEGLMRIWSAHQGCGKVNNDRECTSKVWTG